MTSIVHTGRAAVGRRPHALRMLVLEHASFLGRLVSGILDAKLLRRLDHRGQQAALLVRVERELLLRSHRRRVKRRCLLMVVVAATSGSIRAAVLHRLLLEHLVRLDGHFADLLPVDALGFDLGEGRDPAQQVNTATGAAPRTIL